ncbi:bifunctional metallophosphatase/5'-nucleotidase [Cesiribacter andamanensis]|uniref:Putative 5'-nucleotidase n=1 Tax=Cesiribacter andamanensis AMV16 TaxID=1279009 RepID=M7MY13_9BACT|nr:metallophosphoesterase [Cesiribacter andamanensis]EMR01323.1 putative 5'-nucleotidase precursor [Cesiribacter andamanensis AMV16]
MQRREFIRKAGLATGALATLGPALADARPREQRLTILHTNDMHSRIEPFPSDGRRWEGLGGMARRLTLIERIRSQEEHVLLLDAGDIWQGTPYFNFFNGELEFTLMSRMRYDAATLGNHDFDIGLEGLAAQLPNASFPFLTANYDFSDTILKGKFPPYKVFQKGGIRVGVFGLGIQLKGLVADALFAQTRYLDPVAVAREMVQELRSQGCHLIICLSHLGLEYESTKISDMRLASQVEGIDLIIGGHTHSFLEEPRRVVNPAGQEVLINQVGWSGVYLGRLDYRFDGRGRTTDISWQTMPIDRSLQLS